MINYITFLKVSFGNMVQGDRGDREKAFVDIKVGSSLLSTGAVIKLVVLNLSSSMVDEH